MDSTQVAPIMKGDLWLAGTCSSLIGNFQILAVSAFIMLSHLVKIDGNCAIFVSEIMLRHFDRLSRLTLAVALLYVWLISIATRTIRNGLRAVVDRIERRDLSIVQIGLRFTKRCVTNALPVRITLCSYR